MGQVSTAGVGHYILSRNGAKVINFLRNQKNHIVLQLQKRNRQIIRNEIHELERIFFEAGGIGTQADSENALVRQEKLGLFVLGLIGLNRPEAKLDFPDILEAWIPPKMIWRTIGAPTAKNALLREILTHLKCCNNWR